MLTVALGFPAVMEQDELDTHVEGARTLLADEAARSGPPASTQNATARISCNG